MSKWHQLVPFQLHMSHNAAASMVNLTSQLCVCVCARVCVHSKGINKCQQEIKLHWSIKQKLQLCTLFIWVVFAIVVIYGHGFSKQVDILISKNLALQILYYVWSLICYQTVLILLQMYINRKLHCYNVENSSLNVQYRYIYAHHNLFYNWSALYSYLCVTVLKETW